MNTGPRIPDPRTEPPVNSPQRFRYSEGIAAGLTPNQLRHRGWHVPTFGARARTIPSSAAEDLLAFWQGMPSRTAFSCDSAAVLLGIPTPYRARAGDPVHVRREGHLRARRPRLIGHGGLEHRQVETVQGVAVTSAPDTWLDLAAPGHWGLQALVVAGDAVVNRWTGSPPESLSEVLQRRPRSPGHRIARQALAYIRTGSRSPTESQVRFWMMLKGLPEPLLNHTVLSDAGAFVGEVDFAWEEHRLAVEYDGGYHYADPEALQKTLRRRERLMDAGWHPITLTKQDLRRGPDAPWLADLAQRLLPRQ
ncbi:hypothetical protein I6I18_06945 [Kytococcus sedentarius]|uniref:DUF559 domain-containing protein n=1 Tax=Kytococcus sedentarius (strain ATCC 14392 / DSM 20547 / JCM 11482 / CCUG 33030 / NBRC 15357 / NCTC 11040 / CCM 314 / 541) TaxID=478801 RepID=C7NJR2_KYTSD|nr:hypothetical protein [Kytococcus sedentarius]ACV06844.1 hypothetical protein Ksed_18420 [Kytococcus sedentarius DSM 20547]QQB62867.1 hypothetical protein I6I18_06945 [Kytococcus sedentarius]STX14331.1 Uncharacterised protein [Kytococcus sedentarius]